MGQLSGQLDNSSIVEVIRSIFLHRATGVLEIRSEDKERRFYFVTGELYLPGSHGLAQHLAELLATDAELRARGAVDSLERQRAKSPSEEEREGSVAVRRRRIDEHADDSKARAQAVEQLRSLVERIVAVLVDWTEGEFSFDTDGELPQDLVGPLPTAYLIMDGSVRDMNEDDMLRELGGEQVLVAADTESELLEQLSAIDPGEMFLLSRLEHPIRLGELLRQLPGTRSDALRMLCRLKAVDLVLLPRQPSSESAAQGPSRLDAVVDKFLDRIGKRLETEPIEMDRRDHRRKIGELVAQLGNLNHYELLEVDFHADDRELHGAYEDLARLSHPSHADALQLAGREQILRLIFERATVAYLCLSDSEQRATYNVEAAIDASKLAPTTARTEEQHELARLNYLRAVDLAESQDFHFALELARLAIRADPRPEYFALLGRIQAQNPNWIEQSTESYRQAIRRDPDNAEYRIALAQVMEKAGETVRAKMHYRAALQKSPQAYEAEEALKRLSGSAASVRSEGFFSRLKRFFGQ